jgi:hypothetical protein
VDPKTEPLQRGDYVHILPGTVPPCYANTHGTIYEVNEQGEHWMYVQGGETCGYLRGDLVLVCRNNQRV